MNDENKILACVDRSHFANYVADYAVWAARRLKAPIEFLHVIERHPELATGKDHSGAIGIGAQENLLQRLSQEDEQHARAAREQGRIFLNRLKQHALAAGARPVDVRQRYGELITTIAEQQSGVELVVLGRRGEGAETSGRDLGRNVELVARQLRTPVLTVTEKFKEPERVMLAFDGSAATSRAVEMIAASGLFQGMPIHLLMSGKDDRDAPRQLAIAGATLEAAGFQVHTWSLPGDAESVIARTVVERKIDLLVMGAYSHSPLRNLFVRSKTETLLRAVNVPTLLLR